MASVPHDDIDILTKAKRALNPDYAPSDDEEYMSPQQLNYFRVLLLEWRKSILSAAENTLQLLQDGPIRERDRLGNRAAHARPAAQADRQDRLGAAADRRR